jgi:hypothetical protein
MELSVITGLPEGIICDYWTIIWNYLGLPYYHMELSFHVIVQ